MSGIGLASALGVGQRPIGTTLPVTAKDPHDSWKSTSQMSADLARSQDPAYTPLAIISSPTLLRNIEKPTRTLYVAGGVERAYTGDEVAALVDFYQRGGRLFIADDSGFANQLSRSRAFRVEFAGGTLIDRHYDTSIDFPSFNATLAFGSAYVVVLEKPTLLRVDPAITMFPGDDVVPDGAAGTPIVRVLAHASAEAYLDKDGDRSLGLADSPADYAPVIVVVHPRPHPTQPSEDAGAAVFASDSGLLTNQLWDRSSKEGRTSEPSVGSGNRAFVLDLIAQFLLPDGGTVLVDESRHPESISGSTGALRAAALVLTNPAELTLLIGILALVATVGVLRVGRRLRPSPAAPSPPEESDRGREPIPYPDEPRVTSPLLDDDLYDTVVLVGDGTDPAAGRDSEE